jgi:hypothetical protein
MRFRPANIRLINRRSKLPRLLLALSSKDNKRNRNDKTSPTDWQTLTGHSISEIYHQSIWDGEKLEPCAVANTVLRAPHVNEPGL